MSTKDALAQLQKMKKTLKKQRKSFATLEARLEEDSDDSDITDSDQDGTEHSHFQFSFVTEHVHHNIFTGKPIDMRNVILLDNESTMDLFCNKRFVTDIVKSKDSVKVTSNGGTLLVNHKASLPGYHKPVWYNKNAITNILALHNVKRQYRVTYDSNTNAGDFIVQTLLFTGMNTDSPT